MTIRFHPVRTLRQAMHQYLLAHGLAALSMITTVIPGTIWSELALDRSILLLHVFDLDDEARFIEHFKHTYERPLMEIFE